MPVLGLGLLAVLLGACGSAGDGPAGTVGTGPSSPPTSSGSSGSPTSGGTRLTVIVHPGPGRPPTTWTLTCDPPGGTHPAPGRACAALAAAAPDPFAEVPAGTLCSQIYGGPQTATVTGTWRGRPVQARFSRTDGCQTARWDRLAPLFSPGQPVSR
ncbi:MAG TPA: SSI family serine proteinase inhibitor [Motilibacteraceae bacterium]|nr:SSI family serine proteinase inhibitor [Motilibacteraceae bacterium]